MAVVTNRGSGMVRCTWFAGKKQETGDFSESTLIPYVEEKRRTLGDDLDGDNE